MKLAAAAVLFVALVLSAPACASERHPTLNELEGQVMCPTCHTTLDESSSAIAQRIKAFISARIAAGDTRSEIKRKLVAQFGVGVLAAPPRKGFDLLAWWLPFAGLALAGGLISVAAWRWARGREPREEAAAPLEPELEQRLDEELARFES